MGSICSTFHVFPRCVLTTHYRIQDSALVIHAGDGSRFSDRHLSAPHGPSPRRGFVQDIFHSSPTHRGGTSVQQHSQAWDPITDNPDLVHTPGLAQRDSSHGPSVFWNNETCSPPAADNLLPSTGRFRPLIDTESPSLPHSVYLQDSTFYPNPVSGGTAFPQNSGPLIQRPRLPNYVACLISPGEYPQIQLPSNGSQGPSVIVDQNYVRCEMSARWRYLTLDISQDSMTQHSTFGSGPHNSNPSFSPKMQMIMIPQRSYTRIGNCDKHNPIKFKVNGRPGIPALDAIRKSYAGLDGRDDEVSVGRPSVIMLRLEVCSTAGCGASDDR